MVLLKNNAISMCIKLLVTSYFYTTELILSVAGYYSRITTNHLHVNCKKNFKALTCSQWII